MVGRLLLASRWSTSGTHQLTQRTLDRERYHVRRIPDRISCQMSIARRGLDLRVAEKLADHRQPLAGGDGGRGEGVAQVVDARVL